MKLSIAQASFDYADFELEHADYLRAVAGRIQGYQRAAVVEIGRELLGVKDELEHGQFLKWIRHECHLSVRTAQRAMQAAQIAGKYDKLAHLPVAAILAIAGPAVPEQVIEELAEWVEAGENFTEKEIRARIKELLPPQERAPEHQGSIPGPPSVAVQRRALEEAMALILEKFTPNEVTDYLTSYMRRG
jgi:hypothetical protein